MSDLRPRTQGTGYCGLCNSTFESYHSCSVPANVTALDAEVKRLSEKLARYEAFVAAYDAWAEVVARDPGHVHIMVLEHEMTSARRVLTEGEAQ